MDCREILTSLADLCSDCVPPESAAQMKAHIEECPPCKEEWRQFETTKLMLSTTSQPLLPRVQTQAMWATCLEKLITEVEEARAEKAQPVAKTSPLFGWLQAQPRWNWAALGGALAIFAGVWMFAPRAEAPQQSADDIRYFQVASFQAPPRAASPFIDRHAAMGGFDGFNDHVGSTLVSYSAAQSSSTP